MKIAEFTFPAYMLDIDDARVAKENNRRYTMRDIGRLEQRLENVEYYTALNLLEAETQSLEVLDSNGLNRFKSGFLVDNFKGHLQVMFNIQTIETLWIWNKVNFVHNTR